MLPDGSFVVIFTDYSGDRGGEGNDVYYRQFDPSGQPLGEVQQINITTDGDQSYGSVVNGDSLFIRLELV